MVETRDVAEGLWLWRQRHPAWSAESDWEPEVASFVVATGGEVVLIDALAPSPSAVDVWARIETAKPTIAVVLKPDHVRDIDLFVRWYGVRAFGPQLFYAGEAPRSKLEFVQAGDELPGGLRALHDGRWERETPLYLPEQRALVFADALTAPAGILRIWTTPWMKERTIPYLRSLLDLPFEHVLVSHGEPIHNREEFEAALEREPWPHHWDQIV